MLRIFKNIVANKIYVLAIQYTTTEISHILQGLEATTYYSVSVLAVLKDTGVTDVSEMDFKTGK